MGQSVSHANCCNMILVRVLGTDLYHVTYDIKSHLHITRALYHIHPIVLVAELFLVLSEQRWAKLSIDLYK